PHAPLQQHLLQRGRLVRARADLRQVVTDHRGHLAPHRLGTRRVAACLLLNHTLDVRNNKTLFQLVKTEFLDRGITDREEIFRSLISRRPRFFREYEANCQSLDRDFFHFVGCTDRYAEDLRRLANMMQRPLAAERFNLGENTQQLPSLTANELAFFDEEYRIYERLARARD
ncbi:MAG: hypothetical protein ACO3Y3_08165, partial [Phycisphaerales bacterium]